MFNLVWGFDPHPLKVSWTIVAIFALAYCIRNWREAIGDKRWAIANTPDERVLTRRVAIAKSNIRVHEILAIKAIFMLLAGITAIASPPPTGRTDEMISPGMLVAPLLLIGDEIGIAYLSYYYNHTRRKAAAVAADAFLIARRHVVPRVEVIGAPEPRSFSATASDPSGTLDVTVDVELHPPMGPNAA